MNKFSADCRLNYSENGNLCVKGCAKTHEKSNTAIFVLMRESNTNHTSLNSRGRFSVGWSSAALRYMSVGADASCSGARDSCSGWYMGGGRDRCRGQRGSSDCPMCTGRSHGTSFRPGHILNKTWPLS